MHDCEANPSLLLPGAGRGGVGVARAEMRRPRQHTRVVGLGSLSCVRAPGGAGRAGVVRNAYPGSSSPPRARQVRLAAICIKVNEARRVELPPAWCKGGGAGRSRVCES